MSRNAALLLAALLVSCGKTSKPGPELPTGSEPSGGQASTGGVDGAGGTPVVVAEPNCAVSVANDRHRYCAVYEDGSVWCWGVIDDLSAPSQDPAPTRVAGISAASRVFMASGSSCALVSGALWCWGDNTNGKLTDSGQFLAEATQITIGNGQPIREVGIDPEQLCVADVFSHVYCRNGSRQLQVGVAGGPLTRMTGPGTEVIDEQGRIFSLLDPLKPALDAAARTNNYAVSYGTPSCWLKRSGSLWCTDYSLELPGPARVEPKLGEDVVQMGTGDLFKCALVADGRVWCEGLANVGQTGHTASGFAWGDFIPELTDVRQLSVGYASSCALRADGSVWCWGAYDNTGATAPRKVTSCEGQRTPLEPVHITAPTLLGAHVAEAGLARAQAMCICTQGVSASDECELAEDRSPNGACLDALLPSTPDRIATATCLAQSLLEQASCYAGPDCEPGRVPTCSSREACGELSGIGSYCRRRSCLSDPSEFVEKSQLCDGNADCADGSDELNCVPGSAQFDCGDGGGGVAVDRLCDGNADCSNRADEAACLQLD